MIPILYDSSENSFTNMGLGNLSDTISCKVEEELNGSYELTMEYPVNGKRAKDIESEKIIYAVPSKGAKPQPFRIYEVEKDLSGTMTVTARHRSYDLSKQYFTPITFDENINMGNGIQRQSTDGFTPTKYMTEIKARMLDRTEASKWTFSCDSDLDTLIGAKKIKFDTITGVRSALGSLVEEYQKEKKVGELVWDNWNVKLVRERGTDSGITIRYGKNLTSLKSSMSTDDMYTSLYVFWKKQEDYGIYMTHSDVIDAVGISKYAGRRIMTLDVSSEYETNARGDGPSTTELNTYAKNYIASNEEHFGVPIAEITISFTDPSNLESAIKLSNVQLGDKVTVVYNPFNLKIGYKDGSIQAKTKVTKTDYNVLEDRYNSIELGTINQRENLATSTADAAGYYEQLKGEGVTSGSVSSGVRYVERLISEKVSADSLIANSGYIDVLNTNELNAETVRSDMAMFHALYSDEGYIGKLVTGDIQVTDIDAQKIKAVGLDVDTATMGSIAAEFAQLKAVSAGDISADKITALNGFFDNLYTGMLQTGTIDADKITAGEIGSKLAYFDMTNVQNASIKEAMIDDAQITNAKIKDATITAGKFGTLDGNLMNVTGLNVGWVNGKAVSDVLPLSTFLKETADATNDSKRVVTKIFSGTGSSDPYLHIARIKINDTYVNETITLQITQRGSNDTFLSIAFTNSNTKDPDLALFTRSGDMNYYMYHTAASTWDLYMQKYENWEGAAVVGYNNPYFYIDTTTNTGEEVGRIGFIWYNEEVAAIPDGAIAAVYDQTQIFKRLTAQTNTTSDNDQGIYIKDNKIYINAQGIQAGYISADRIASKSLNADKIEVDDLSAISASIGGLKLENGSIHSAGNDLVLNKDGSWQFGSSSGNHIKSSDQNANFEIVLGKQNSTDTGHSGFYLGSDGKFMMGGPTSNYIQFDGTSLNIIAASMMIGGSAAVTQSSLTQGSLVSKLTGNSDTSKSSGEGIYIENGKLRIDATMIKTGVITNAAGTMKIDLDQGNIYAANLSFSDGKTVTVGSARTFCDTYQTALNSSHKNDVPTCGVLQTFQSNFQAGCSTIAQACSDQGVHPASNSPTDIAAAIRKLSDISGTYEGSLGGTTFPTGGRDSDNTWSSGSYGSKMYIKGTEGIKSIVVISLSMSITTGYNPSKSAWLSIYGLNSSMQKIGNDYFYRSVSKNKGGGDANGSWSNIAVSVNNSPAYIMFDFGCRASTDSTADGDRDDLNGHAIATYKFALSRAAAV